jgi:peptide deformylase
MTHELDIHTIGDSVLRKRAEPIPEITPELVELAHQMLQTMYDAPGVGLAAPQVGHSIRLVVCDVAFREEDEEGNPKKDPMILFNPEITPVADCGLEEDEEGCLSVPEIFARVNRPTHIHLKYQNEKGEQVVMNNLGGFLARCVQHEVDHLNGVLFVDKMNPKDRILLSGKLKKMARNNQR